MRYSRRGRSGRATLDSSPTTSRIEEKVRVEEGRRVLRKGVRQDGPVTPLLGSLTCALPSASLCRPSVFWPHAAGASNFLVQIIRLMPF